MQSTDYNETTPQTQEAEGIHQLRMLLALFEQGIPEQKSRATAQALSVSPGVDAGYFELRFMQDRRTETLSMLPYRERRAVRR